MAGAGVMAGWLTGCRDGNTPARAGQEMPAGVGRESLTGEPSYLNLHRTGELRRRAESLFQRLRRCDICPRQCGVDRTAGEKGVCQATDRLEIASFQPHFGEERPLVGRGGSGTIFFSNCNLRCVFCINWEISQGGHGTTRSVSELAEMMLALQRRGCLNINVVTPTHYSPHILAALDEAAGEGLRLPLVYNTSGWERLEILQLLEGVVDIYLPDFKYADGSMAARYSAGAGSYPEVTRTALLEMQRQVGTAVPDPNGRMARGLMVRHLVMPNDVSGTCAVMGWIAANLPRSTWITLMSQYRPMYKADEYSAINRRLNRAEYAAAVRCARENGLTRLDLQGYPAA
jgi:putative pyruvate formate lyase activating enzyme